MSHTKSNVILGIDPGLQSTGYGVIHYFSEQKKYAFIACGKISTSPKKIFPERLGEIFFSVSELISMYNPHQVAIEKVFLNTNPHSTLLLGQARGASICAAVIKNLPVFEYTALQIKKSVVGYGHATKSQVQFMVAQLLDLNALPTPDAADALAGAICHSNQLNFFS